MPELPEVEALARFLTKHTSGRIIAGVEVGNIAALKTFDPPPQSLVGRSVSNWARRGKWLIMATEPGGPESGGPEQVGPEQRGTIPGASVTDSLCLAVHLARGGWVRWCDKLPATPVKPRLGGSGKAATTALRVRFDSGAGFDLTEAGTRKRLAVFVVRDPSDVPQIAELGVEPLSPSFTVAALTGLVADKNQQLKGLLRDQSRIAGIGNAYSDEVLHAARMSPFRLTGSLKPAEISKLHAVIVDTLDNAVRAAAGKPAKELKDAKRAEMRVHGRAGQPCPECGDTIREVSFADRALQYCPTCQTGGKHLADRRLSKLLR